MHWCMDETLAVLAMIPFIGYFFRKLHIWWHKHFNHKCHEDGCDETHLEHCHMPENIPHGKAGEGQCCQHPLPWDEIDEDDLKERVGKELLDDLKFIVNSRDDLVGVTDEEFVWYINDSQEVKAEVRGRVFVHDYNCCEHGWDEVFH